MAAPTPPTPGSSTRSTARRTTPTASRSRACRWRSRTPTAWSPVRSSSRSAASCSPPSAAVARGSATSRLACQRQRRRLGAGARATGLQSRRPRPDRGPRPADRGVAPHSRGARWFGSPALCLAYVAAGRLDAFFERDATYAWDVAAGRADDHRGGRSLRGSRRRPAQPRPRHRQRARHQRHDPRRPVRPDPPHRQRRVTRSWHRVVPLRGTSISRAGRRLCSVRSRNTVMGRCSHDQSGGNSRWPTSFPSTMFLDGWYPGWKPEHLDNHWLRMKSGPFTKEDEEQLLVRRLPLAARLLAARHDVRPRRRRGARSSPRTSCRCRRPAASCSAWVARSSTRARCRSPRSGRSATAPPASSATCRSSSRTSTRSGKSASGSSSSASATSRATTSPASRWPSSASTCATPSRFQQRAWEIHFEIMYPLLAIYLQLYGVCAENGIDPGEHRQDAPGPRLTRSWRPTGRCGTSSTRPSGSASPTSSPARGRRHPRRARRRPAATPRSGSPSSTTSCRSTASAPRASPTSTSRRGSRTSTSPLGQIRNFIAIERAPRLRRRRSRTRIVERDEAIDDARSQLSAARRSARSTSCSAINQVANFAWWNEDHNYYIDLRASIPMRARRAGDRRARRRRQVRRRAVPVLPRAARRVRRQGRLEDLQAHGHRPSRLLRRLPEQALGGPEGRRHAARQDRRPGADRDLRHAQALLRGPEVRRPHHRAQGLPGLGRRLHRAVPG